MAETRAALRYVKSLLGLAVERNALEEVHADMLAFSKVLHENREFGLVLRNPIIRHQKKRDILERLFKDRFHSLTLAIFDILTRKNREALLPVIAKEFHNAYNDFKGIGKASVITAVPLDPSTRTRLEDVVKKLSDKKEIELTEKIDASLIGGFILNVGDRQIDTSLKSRLKALQVQFSQNPYIKEI